MVTQSQYQATSAVDSIKSNERQLWVGFNECVGPGVSDLNNEKTLQSECITSIKLRVGVGLHLVSLRQSIERLNLRELRIACRVLLAKTALPKSFLDARCFVCS
jgi:hypothetical protein